MTEQPEICICAAVKSPSGLIIRGQRHHNALQALSEIENILYPFTKQGFITSQNRFVSRKEGLRLQLAAGISSVNSKGYRYGLLFSEDLY